MLSNEKICYILRGQPCSGKTTYRKEHLADLPCVSLDDYIEAKMQELNLSYDKAWARFAFEAGEHKRKIFLECMKNGKSFVIDAMNLSQRITTTDIVNLLTKGFTIHEITFHVEQDIINERRSRRVGKTTPDCLCKPVEPCVLHNMSTIIKATKDYTIREYRP